jgi:hypothetical protein
MAQDTCGGWHPWHGWAAGTITITLTLTLTFLPVVTVVRVAVIRLQRKPSTHRDDEYRSMSTGYALVGKGWVRLVGNAPHQAPAAWGRGLSKTLS